MEGRLWELCAGVHCDAAKSAKYRALWDQQKLSEGGKVAGLGDVVAFFAKKTGLARLAKGWTKVTGKDCGCVDRQQALNAAMPSEQQTYHGDTERTEVLITSDLPPGDIVVYTGALRELHEQYPERFRTAVQTTAQELWAHHPYVEPVGDGARRVEFGYSQGNWASVHKSNQRPATFLAAACESLAIALGLPTLLPYGFAGEVPLSDEEKSWIPQVEERFGRPQRYVLVNAGVKRDYTAKAWPVQHYQQVIDLLGDGVAFVQIGAAEHEHPPLRNVVDLRGQSDHRQLVRLVYHADAVLTGVSYPMHLAAAVEAHPRLGFRRPAFVAAGGREPPWWYAYPGHQFFSTVGLLPCCRAGGCWKARTLPLGDGDEKDQSLCERPLMGYPDCMWMVTPQRVAEALHLYLESR